MNAIAAEPCVICGEDATHRVSWEGSRQAMCADCQTMRPLGRAVPDVMLCPSCGDDDFREGCPFCGRTITDDGHVCFTCREPVEPMRFCATCGDEWPAEASR